MPKLREDMEGYSVTRLTFEQRTSDNGRPLKQYTVTNKKDEFLGIVYKKGKTWKWEPEASPFGEMWFTSDCLRELADFMDSLEA